MKADRKNLIAIVCVLGVMGRPRTLVSNRTKTVWSSTWSGAFSARRTVPSKPVT